MHFNYALTDWLLIIHQNCLHKKECFYVGHNWPGNKHYFWFKHLGREKKLNSVTAYLTFSFLKLTIKGFRISTSSLLGQLQHFKVRVGREWTGCVYTVQWTVLYCRCMVLPVRVTVPSSASEIPKRMTRLCVLYCRCVVLPVRVTVPSSASEIPRSSVPQSHR